MHPELEELLADREVECRATHRVLVALEGLDESAAGRAHEVAWHLVQAYDSILRHHALDLGGPGRDAPRPSPDRVPEIYRQVTRALADEIRGWSVTDLDRTDPVYDEVWSRRRTLAILMRHEIHHRGQITALMRLAGAWVPATYGPSADERRPPEA